MDVFLLGLHLLFCFGTMFSAFCRLHHCTAEVKKEVRWSIAGMGAAFFAMAMAPFLGWMNLYPVVIVAEGCTMAYFVAGSQAWVYGIPHGLSNAPIFDRRRGPNDRRTGPRDAG